MEQATWKAVDDAGLDRNQMSELDALVIVKRFREATRNSPEALANRLGAANASRWLTPDGGQGQQYLVNHFSEIIANGEIRFALITGAEAIKTASRHVRNGDTPDWSVPSHEDPHYLYPDRDMTSLSEKAHDMWNPTHVYPLFENALRHHYTSSIEVHQHRLTCQYAILAARVQLYCPQDPRTSRNDQSPAPRVRQSMLLLL